MARVQIKPLIVFASIAFAAFVTYSTAIGKQSKTRIGDLKSQITNRQTENAALRSEISDLRRQLSALQNRPEVLERQIRSDMGLVRSDEVIVAFPEGGSAEDGTP